MNHKQNQKCHRLFHQKPKQTIDQNQLPKIKLQVRYLHDYYKNNCLIVNSPNALFKGTSILRILVAKNQQDRKQTNCSFGP